MQLEALQKKGRFQQMFDDAGRIQTRGLYEQCTSIAGGIMSRPARLFNSSSTSKVDKLTDGVGELQPNICCLCIIKYHISPFYTSGTPKLGHGIRQFNG